MKSTPSPWALIFLAAFFLLNTLIAAEPAHETEVAFDAESEKEMEQLLQEAEQEDAEAEAQMKEPTLAGPPGVPPKKPRQPASTSPAQKKKKIEPVPALPDQKKKEKSKKGADVGKRIDKLFSNSNGLLQYEN